MKALVGAFNQEKALVGAFSVIVRLVVEPMEHYTALFLMSTLLWSSRMAEDLLISLVMVVVANSWAYGELPRSNNLWHFPDK